MNAKPTLGVIGGSGLYGMPGLEIEEARGISTPFGKPSGDLLLGHMLGTPVAFLSRHGEGHVHSPSGINYRANVFALKSVGVTHLLSLSAVGSLREELEPGRFVIVDQFIDRTCNREKSFFGEGLVAHVSCADPVCAGLGDRVEAAGQQLGLRMARGGTYLCMEGPQFSTRAESEMYRAWGCSVIGMTNQPEAKLAREAQLCYATVGMVTDYDCWHDGHDAVEVTAVIEVLRKNAECAQKLVAEVARGFGGGEGCRQSCSTALDNALITAPQARNAKTEQALSVLLDPVVQASRS